MWTIVSLKVPTQLRPNLKKKTQEKLILHLVLQSYTSQLSAAGIRGEVPALEKYTVAVTFLPMVTFLIGQR